MPGPGKGLGRYAGGKRRPERKGTKDLDKAGARDGARLAALERTAHELVAAVHGRVPATPDGGSCSSDSAAAPSGATPRAERGATGDSRDELLKTQHLLENK